MCMCDVPILSVSIKLVTVVNSDNSNHIVAVSIAIVPSHRYTDIPCNPRLQMLRVSGEADRRACWDVAIIFQIYYGVSRYGVSGAHEPPKDRRTSIDML